MKLYDIPRWSKIKLEIVNAETKESSVEVCEFDHIDGMYSFIKTPTGSVVHLFAGTPLKFNDEEGCYEIDEENEVG